MLIESEKYTFKNDELYQSCNTKEVEILKYSNYHQPQNVPIF